MNWNASYKLKKNKHPDRLMPGSVFWDTEENVFEWQDTICLDIHGPNLFKTEY